MTQAHESLPIARSPLVGRLTERDAVADAVAAAVVHNRCEVVTLVGNPGVGKTRLVQELVADLAERYPDVRVYKGAARADVGVQAAIAQILRERFGLHEGTDAHAQANEVCAQVMDLFGDRRVDEILHFLGVFLGLRFGGTLLAEAFDADPRAYQHVARAVLRRLFEVDAQRAPIVLVFEDIHLAGPDGLRTLRELSESLRRAPVVVVNTARPELFARMHDFCDAPVGRHRRVDLAPLEPGESTVLARMLLSTIESCPEELISKAVELGGGNPLLIEQIVRVYFDQGVIQVDGEGMATIDLDRLEQITLPQSMEEAVRARLSALSPAEREMLERAALMGPTFWLGGLVVLGRTHEPPPKLWGGAEDLALHYRDLLKGLVDRGYVERPPRRVRAALFRIADQERPQPPNRRREPRLRLTRHGHAGATVSNLGVARRSPERVLRREQPLLHPSQHMERTVVRLPPLRLTIELHREDPSRRLTRLRCGADDSADQEPKHRASQELSALRLRGCGGREAERRTRRRSRSHGRCGVSREPNDPVLFEHGVPIRLARVTHDPVLDVGMRLRIEVVREDVDRVITIAEELQRLQQIGGVQTSGHRPRPFTVRSSARALRSRRGDSEPMP